MRTKRRSPTPLFSGWKGRFGLLLLTLTFPLLSACSGSDGTTDPVDPVGPATMTALEGMGARGPAGTVVPVGPTVQLLENLFVPTVPSTNQPNPLQGAYFTGGYNTVRHGSRDGGNVSGIQIEHHYPGLRDTAENRERYAEALADALSTYFTAHFGMELAPPPG
jgi:hypothetical protein